MRSCKIILVVLSILFAFSSVYSQTKALSPTDDTVVGMRAAEEIESQYKPYPDAELAKAVNQLGAEIVRYCDRPDIDFTFKVLDDDMINAFSLPGGYIYLMRGLMEMYSKHDNYRDLVAFVIGHEVAHVVLRHYANNQKMVNVLSTKMDIQTEEGLKGAKILMAGYSKQDEFEADQYGSLYMLRAGYTFESCVKALKILKEATGDVEPFSEAELLADHPRYSERIANLYNFRAKLEEAYSYFEYGLAARNAGNLDASIKYFKAFLAMYPHSATGYANLGSAYLEKGLATLPELKYGLKDMVLYYKQPSGVNLRAGEDQVSIDKAIENFQKALQYDPNSSAVYNNYGILLVRLGKYDDAIKNFEKAIAIDGEYAPFYNQIGNAQFLKGNTAEAEANYKKAIELSSDWAMPYYNIALLYEETKQNDKAKQVWEALASVSGYDDIAKEHLAKLGGGSTSTTPTTITLKPETAIAGVKVGDKSSSVERVLGKPESEFENSGVLFWSYNTKGVLVGFDAKKSTSVVAVTKGFTGKSANGLKIGDDVQTIRKIYGRPEDIQYQNNGEAMWLYKEIGIFIQVYDKVVTAMAITGPAGK